MFCGNHKRCSPRPSMAKMKLQLPFFVALRGPWWTKRNCSCRSSWFFVALGGQKEVAVAVLRGSSWPLVDEKKLQLPFFVVLRGPWWTKRTVAVLRGPSWPLVDRSCSCRSSWFFVALGGQKEIAVAVLRGPSWPLVDEKKLQLPFFVVLHGPWWTKRNCSCRSSWFFMALRGQKEVAVAVSWSFVALGGRKEIAVAVLRVALRGQKEVAVAVLRGSSWPFVDEKKLQLPFFVALRGQKEAAVAVLRVPPWLRKGVLSRPLAQSCKSQSGQTSTNPSGQLHR